MNLETKAYNILKKEHRVVYAGPVRRLDDDTLLHSQRVSETATELAARWGLSGSDLVEVKVASLLHDAGKVFCDPEVLWFPGVLSEEEKAEIHLHPVDSERIAIAEQIPPRIRRFIRQHHEKFDGTGYPDELRGQEISVGASIIKIADEWDRMRHPVPWRTWSLSPYEAAEEIRRYADKRYPRMLVDTVFESWYKQKGYNGKE